MNKTFVLTILMALCVAITACGGSDSAPVEAPSAPTPEPEPAVPEPEPEPEPAADSDVEVAAPVEGEAQVVETANALGGEGEMVDMGSEIGSVACDEEARKITFTFSNTGKYTWNLDQQAPLAGGEERNVKVFINGYEANKKNVQFHPDNGEPMFGPNEKFSDNCGGVVKMEQGTELTCTLENVKLNRGTGTDELNSVNEIWIDSPNVDDHIEFTC